MDSREMLKTLQMAKGWGGGRREERDEVGNSRGAQIPNGLEYPVKEIRRITNGPDDSVKFGPVFIFKVLLQQQKLE